MNSEAVEGFLALPVWVQWFLGFFALTFIVMLRQAHWVNARVSKRFNALAAASDATVIPGTDKFSASFELERDGRRFTLRRELRDSTSSRTWRGPRGQLLYAETPLAHDSWARHGVDIAEEGSLAPLGSMPFKTGDASFDKRFTAWQSGVPVRSGWLDASTRAAVTAFFDTTPLSGSLWVREGLLQYVTVAPKGMDASALDQVLHAQAAVAQAFESTAG